MGIHEQRVRRHADERLGEPPSEAAGRIRSFRTFLDVEADRLEKRHRFGLGGREIARGRSDVIDVVVARACRLVAEDLGPAARSDLAACGVLALGGYGRRELSPASDVDVLILHPGRRAQVVTDFVQALLPLLWDIGLEVGHGVRSIAECVQYGRTDLHARNAMSEARLVTGAGHVFERFASEMHEKVFGHPKSNRFFREAMAAEVEGRRARFGPVVGMQEPHLKEGAGGLRDLHVVGWVGLARWGLRDLDGLHEAGLMSAVERARAVRAYDFILRVRNEAHFRTGRRTDLISLELQPGLAASLDYSDQKAASASEIFMRDFYMRARELQRFCDAFLLRADFWEPEAPVLSLGRPKSVAVGPEGRYRLRDGRLLPDPESGALPEHPTRLMEAFQVAQRHGAPISHELQELVRKRLPGLDRRARSAHELATAFLELLRVPGRVSGPLRAMHECGLLGRYLPEFRRVTLMVQHDHYHRYTIDEHTLKTLEALDELVDGREDPDQGGRDPARATLRSAVAAVEHPQRLTLGLLLHDIGKGQGGDHVTRGVQIGRRVCRRLGLTDEATDDVLFLIGKHLVMSRVSQRRDLSDPAVIRGFADTVRTVDRLRMLFVLTYADITGVGPGTWNEWKAALLHELYERTHELLTTPGAGVTHGAAVESPLADRVLAELDPEFLRSDVEEFLGHLPARYARLVPPHVIACHFEMSRALGSGPLLARWHAAQRGPYTVLSVCVRDRRGVLGRLAGGLTGAGLDILSVDVFTRDDGVVLDVFRVCESMGASAVQPVSDARAVEITRELEAVLSGERDPADAVERQRTRQVRRRARRTPASPAVRFVEPDASGRTVVEVRADDEPGLVYRIATTLSLVGLDIALAKIATEKNQALDVFYVTGGGGAPVDERRHPEIERALLEALTRRA